MFTLKVKTHIEDMASARNFRFTFHRALAILGRRIRLPNAILPYGFTGEKHLMKYMDPLHNGCFVDVGASIGVWTEPLAKKGVTVHAFEPSPRPHQKLVHLARTHPNIQVYPYALGDDCYNSKLNLHHGSGHNSIVQKAWDFTGHQMLVTVRTLDSFKLENVGLIKIDTQAYELQVLQGAKETIARDKPRLIIEVHYPYKQHLREITRFLRELGYQWIVELVQGKPHFHVIGDPA